MKTTKKGWFVGVRNTVFPSKFWLNPGIPPLKKLKSRHRHVSRGPQRGPESRHTVLTLFLKRGTS